MIRTSLLPSSPARLTLGAAFLSLAAFTACSGGGGASGTGGMLGSGGALSTGGAGTGGARGGSGGSGGTGMTGSGGSPGGAGGVQQAAGGNGAGAPGGAGVGGSGGGGATASGGTGPADGGVQSDAAVGGRGGATAVGSGGSAGGRGGGAGGGRGGASGTLRAAMVVRGAGTATAGDMVMLARLAAHGFQVSLFGDAAVTAAAVASMDLVVVSSSAESGPLGTKLRDVTIPMLCVENGQYGNQGMTGTTRDTNWGEIADQTAVTIVAGAPAELVGTFTGNVTISRTAGPIGWGLPAATALKGATVVGAPNQAVIFGYTAGTQMVGMAAPARRAGFAIREVLAAGLDADGMKLFDTVLEWVLR